MQAFRFGVLHKDTWYIDSGCARHMTAHKGYLRDFNITMPGLYVTFGNNVKGEYIGHGNISNWNFTVKHVAYIDGLKHNLISVAQLYDNDHEVLFTKTKSLIMDTNKHIHVDSPQNGNMYPLDIELIDGAQIYGFFPKLLLTSVGCGIEDSLTSTLVISTNSLEMIL